MKKIIFSALSSSALLALAACGGADEAATDEAAMADQTTVDMSADDSAMEGTTTDSMMDGTDDSVTISEDGVDAQINDGDTSVTADLDEDPAVTVQD